MTFRKFPSPGLTAQEKAARRGRQVRFALKRKRGVWEGTVVLPIGMTIPTGAAAARPTTRVTARRGVPKAETAVTARATDKQSAIAQAAGLARSIANNPLVAAALPPGTGQAVRALELVAKHAPLGKLEDGLKKLTGEGAKRLVSALKFW